MFDILHQVRSRVGITNYQEIIKEKVKCVLTHCAEFPEQNSKRPPGKIGPKVEQILSPKYSLSITTFQLRSTVLGDYVK